MIDPSDGIPQDPLGTIIGIETNKTKSVPIDDVIVVGPSRPLSEPKVVDLVESISQLGLLSPLVGVLQREEDGREKVRVVAGGHRLEAIRRLGLPTIQCTILARDEALRVELAQIDENIIRHNPSPAEHAILTRRRSEIIKELTAQKGTLTHGETPSKKQALRRSGQKTGHDVASIRDQAKRTGESAGKIQRAKKRSGILGSLLSKVVGTSLDKGPELDALAKLPKEEREDLVNRATAGEAVSARTPDFRPKPTPERKPKLTRLQKANAELDAWSGKYRDLKVMEVIGPHLMDIGYDLAAAIEEEMRVASTVGITDTRESG